MDLSIIIVNWKSAGYLAACLDSIVAGPPGVDWECIVIDNASGDGSEELCAKNYPFVIFIQSAENRGFAGANNLGAARASGETFLFLNPDTIVKSGALQLLYKGLMSNPRNGAAGPRLLNRDGSLQTTCVLPFPSILSDLLDSERLKMATRSLPLWGIGALFSKSVAPKNVDALSGASLLVRKSVFEKVRGFSTDYFMYSEDIDLCAKIRRSGFMVKYVPGSEIVHLGGTSSQLSEKTFFSSVMIKESNRILLKKFRGPVYALLYRLSMGVAAAVRLLLLFIVPSRMIPAKKLAKKKWFAILQWSAGSGKHVTAV